MKCWFDNAEQSHQHSLQTLNTLYEFDDFMKSVDTVLDLGCGSGLDMLWWSTRTTRDIDNPQPLNIRCTGVDLAEHCPTRHPLITYRCRDFETDMDLPKKRFDILWCHDAFHYVADPYETLVRWRDRTDEKGMLVLVLPQTTNLVHNKQQFELLDGCNYHWTLPSLIRMLAITGWDCAGGFFRKPSDDPWLHAIVYKGQHDPFPKKTRWYDLADAGVLPESAIRSIDRRGYLSQQDLLLPWIDRSLASFLNY